MQKYVFKTLLFHIYKYIKYANLKYKINIIDFDFSQKYVAIFFFLSTYLHKHRPCKHFYSVL